MGETDRTLTFGGELEYGSLSGDFELEVGGFSLAEFELELSAAGDFTASERRPLQMAQTLVGFVGTAWRVVELMRAKALTNPQWASVLVEASSVISDVVTAYSAGQDELVDLLTSKVGGSGTRRLKVTIGVEHKNGSTTRTITLAYVSEMEHELEVGNVSSEVSVSRERRILSIEWPRS